MTTKRNADLQVSASKNLVGMLAQTERGREWMEARLDRGAWQWVGDWLFAAPQFMVGVVDLALEDGLTVDGMEVK